MKTKSTPTYNTKNNFKIMPKSIKKNKSSNIHHKKNQKYTIKKKINPIIINPIIINPKHILAAKSLELTEVQPKSPITPLSSGSMESSPPPLPSTCTPTTNNDKNNANPLSNHNIK